MWGEVGEVLLECLSVCAPERNENGPVALRGLGVGVPEGVPPAPEPPISLTDFFNRGWLGGEKSGSIWRRIVLEGDLGCCSRASVSSWIRQTEPKPLDPEPPLFGKIVIESVPKYNRR